MKVSYPLSPPPKQVRLGKQVKITSKSVAKIVNNLNVECPDDHVIVDFLIGSSHSGILIMSLEAWEDFNKGDEVTTETVKQFKTKIR